MKIRNSFQIRGATNVLLRLSTAILMITAGGVRADSPSDLLEQGIYSEETKGDVDGAMQLYQKVIAQSKADQALAAQAQYHLGACYYKKQDYTNATATFEQLVKDYPDQTNIVARARKYLAGVSVPLQPAPWTDGEVMHLDLKLGGGLKIGMAEYTVNAGETNGQKIWRFGSLVDAAMGGSQSASHVEVEAGTLKPLHSVWKHNLLGKADAVYYTDHADLKTGDKEESKKLEFDGSVIDNEEAVEWMRCLPLAEGYTNTQQILSSLGSHVIAIKLTVSGPEQVEVPAGTYQCYKLEMNIGQTFWYSSDPKHYLVKFEAGGAVAELTAVTQRAPGEAAAYTDAEFGFSLTAPAGWAFDKEATKTANKTSVSIIDPQAVGTSSLVVQTMALLKTNEAASIRDFANARIAEAATEYKDFKVRPDSWKEFSLSGQPALSVVCDYAVGKAKTVGYGVWTFGATNASYFQSLVPVADFEAFRPQIDAVINSYQTK